MRLQLIAEFKARIQCKHCGKTSHYSDHFFQWQRQQKEDRSRSFLLSQGLSEEEIKAVVEDAKKVFNEDAKSCQKGKGKGKGANKGPEQSSENPKTSDEGACDSKERSAKRKRAHNAFSEVEKVVDLLRAAAKDGLSL